MRQKSPAHNSLLAQQILVQNRSKNGWRGAKKQNFVICSSKISKFYHLLRLLPVQNQIRPKFSGARKTNFPTWTSFAKWREKLNYKVDLGYLLLGPSISCRVSFHF